MKLIVVIYFDHDRPVGEWKPANGLQIDTNWIDRRVEIFKNTTLKSLEAQTYKDFEIWLFCGQRFKDYTAGKFAPLLKEHHNIKLIYDLGKEQLSKINEDYLVLSRLDSDDLYHYKALQIIYEYSLKKCSPKSIRIMVIRKALLWDRTNNLIGYHYREAPPFITQIFPKKLYKKFSIYEKSFCVKHGNLGGRKLDTIELPKHLVCVVKHDVNVSMYRNGITNSIISLEKIQELENKNLIVTANKKKMKSILRSFGQVIE